MLRYFVNASSHDFQRQTYLNASSSELSFDQAAGASLAFFLCELPRA